MKKILSLYINLLLFIISEAVPLKLIAGDSSVVKKDGATHTISKYYVVPNDFNLNNVTNNTETSQTTLRMNHSINSKSMEADTASQHQVSEKIAEAANNQTNEMNADVNINEVNLRSDLSDVQVVQAESTGSVKTEENLGPDDLGNLQVEPIANFTNINSSVTTNEVNVFTSREALQNGTIITEENTTQTFKKDVEVILEDLILAKFVAVQENSVQNLESFWKLIKLNMDTKSDDDELLTKIDKLSLLSNIFTNLYEAAQSQKSVELMIDNIIDILQMRFVEVKKSNTNESQSHTDVTGDYDEECLRKKRSKPQLDSNSTYLAETGSQEASDNLELKNLQTILIDLQRRQRDNSDDGGDWVNTYIDPGSNQVTFTNQPSNILRSQLLVPNNLNVGVPYGFDVRSSTPMPTLNHVSSENDVHEDPKSNQTIPDSADIDEHLDDQLLTMKSRFTVNIMPWTIEDKSNKNLDDQPLTIESKLADNIMPWHIDDKTTEYLPWHIEDKTTNHQPWIIELTKKLPWKVKNRADPNWIIENIMGHSPKTLYQSRYPSVITHGGKILLHPNQPMTGTIHSVKNGVNKPYHIYTYVLSPETSLNEIPTLGNIVKVKSRQPNANLETKLHGLSTSHGGNKIVYTNQLSPSYYESQFGLSKPSVDISSQLVTNNEVNPSDLFSETTQDDNQLIYLVGHEPKTNLKAALLQPNTLPSDSQINSDQENEVPQGPKVVLLPNDPSTRFESLINLGNTKPVSPFSADTTDVNPDIGDTEPNPYNPNINLNRIQQTNLHPGVISKPESSPVNGGETHKHSGLISTASSSSAYTNVPHTYDEPSPVYGGEIHKHPDLISKASSSSEYKKLPDFYDEPSPLYGGETHKRPGLISKASSSSAYKNLPDVYDEPSPLYGGETQKHPGLISKASSSSAYTNLPHTYDEPSPVYGGEIHKHPDLISKASSSSEYKKLPDVYDEPSPLYGGETHKHPGLISTSSSSSASTKLLGEYDEPSLLYGGETHKHPGLISKASSSYEYKKIPDVYDEPSPLYGGETHKHPGLISKASSSYEYKKIPDVYDEPSPLYGGETHKYPGLISKASSSSEYKKIPDVYDEPSPLYGGKTHKYPGLISKASSSSEYKHLPAVYDEPSSLHGGETHKHPGLISKASSSSEYKHLPAVYDEPSSLHGGETHKHPGLISKASSSSAYTNLPDEYDEPVYGVQTQHPGLISSSASSNSEYTNVVVDYDKPNTVYVGQTHTHPGFISKTTADSEYTNLRNDYNNPIPDYGQYTDRHPGLITKVSHHPEYANVVHGYDEPLPLYGGQIQKHPGFISKASSHSEYTNLPNKYNNPASGYEEDTSRYPVHIQTAVNGRPTKTEDNLLVYDRPYGDKVHVVQPSLIAHLLGNQSTTLNYLKYLKLKLAPTYRLFTLDNLLKLHDAVIKTIKANSDKPDVYNNQELMNLSKIINIILILAKHLEEPKGSIEWYEKIFYNTQRENRHPLEIYVYNLIRQRWLHELILILYKNNFNFNILQNPKIFSFLGSWQFPNYVLNFIEIEELLKHKFIAPELLDQTFSSQDKFKTHTYDDVLEQVPENLENYVTNNVIQSYKTPNAGIVLSIAGVEAEPDANAIIHILQKYLHYKSFIEKQENVIIRDNKVEMLKQIILFLREKGYDANTIADLIRKLYTAVYSTEGKECQTHHPNFAKNMYDVILPVLRRSLR